MDTRAPDQRQPLRLSDLQNRDAVGLVCRKCGWATLSPAIPPMGVEP
jgi:hypothetical protein